MIPASVLDTREATLPSSRVSICDVFTIRATFRICNMSTGEEEKSCVS